MDESVTVDDARRQMVDWLLATEARQAAKAELRRYGIDSYDPGDLINDVVVRVLQADFDVAAANPIAYARRALTNRARDLLSGDRVRRRRHVSPTVLSDDGDERDPLAVLEDPIASDPSVLAVATAVEADLRRRLQVALALTKTWVVAAALTTLTLRLHDDVAVPEDVPTPEVGHRDQADRWAALWLAGEVSAFPDADRRRRDDAAMRQARSRRLREVDALLHHAFEAVRGGGPDA